MTRSIWAALLVALVIPVLPTNSHAQAMCRAFDPGETVATLSDDRIDEASGIAASWRNDGAFWVHNDSGDAARVFAVDADGQTLATLNLPNVDARDFEDIAIGPCAPADETACIWVADFGDNDSVRESVQLYRFPEPDLTAVDETDDAADITTFDFTYADGPRNAETLLVHPTTGRVFVVEKSGGDPHPIWELPLADSSIVATRVGELTLGESALIGGLVTGGDFSPDGRELAVRTYQAIYTVCGDDLAALFTATPVRTIGVDLFQSEALTYARDGVTLWTTTEVRSSEQPPLVRMTPLPTTNDKPDVGTSVDAGADVGRERATPEMGTENDGDGAPATDRAAPNGCSCTTTKKADEPWSVVGLLLLGLFARRRTP